MLIAVQAVHSVEEYAFGLYDVLAPARFISTLISADPARGFAIANLILVAAGIISYGAILWHDRVPARAVAWFWSLLELFNGLGHLIFAAASGGYFPGVATAPLLLAVSGYLLSRLASHPGLPANRHPSAH